MSDTKMTASSPKAKLPAPRRKAVKPVVTKAAAPAPVAAAPVPVVPAPAPVIAAAPKPVAPAPTPVKPAAKPVAAAPKFVAKPPVAPVPTPEPAPIAVVAAEVIPPSTPVIEAPVSAVEMKIASTPTPAFQQTVKLMATLPTPPFKGYEELAAFSKANMEAFVQANTILVKGFEELSKEIMTLTKASMETAATTTKAVFAAKTIKDVVTLQSDFTKSSFDKFVANSSKLSELGVKVASDAIAPVTARVNVAVEKVLKPAA